MTRAPLVADTHKLRNPEQTEPTDDGQYSLLKIMTIWALAAIPMPIMAFVVAPAVTTPGTINALLMVWYLMIAGMVWQFVLSAFLLYRELERFTWTAFKARIWLQAPRDPKSGSANCKLFWWLIPAFLFYVAFEASPIGTYLGELILIPFPALSGLPALDLQGLLDAPELIGAWWLIGVAVISCIFNYLLGEELLFRGVLLPKMRGVFGKWDWAANSVLFAFYHLHRPTQMLGFILGGMAWSLPSRRFRSIWFAIILHGFEGIFLIFGVAAVVSGAPFQ